MKLIKITQNMRAYIIRRLLMTIPTLLLVSIIVFVLVHLMPGDVVDAMEAKSDGAKIDRAAVERELGLDVPLIVQYGRWLGVVPQKNGRLSGVFQGKLGESWWRKKSVLQLVASRWPVTLELGLLAILSGLLVALPIGIFSALHQDRIGDYIGRTFAILAISVPAFWVGTLVIIFPSIWWGYMASIMPIPFTEDPMGHLKMFIVPAIILGLHMSGMTMRMTRSMVLEVMRQDYIRTAWAKGLKERVIITRHTLKNALIPVVTIVGMQLPLLIGGTVIIENIFVLPGMGRLLVTAISDRDHPLISGITFLIGVGLVLINLLVDLTYGYLDPRVKYR